MKSLNEDPNVKSSYYDGRGEACIVFVCSGVAITFIFFALCNALQHPKIPESLSNLLIGALPLCLIAALDSKSLMESLDLRLSLLITVAYTTFILVNLLRYFDKLGKKKLDRTPKDQQIQ